MSLSQRVEGRLGQIALHFIRKAGRRRVRADVLMHVDGRGRRTPYLRCGTPTRGTLIWLHGFSDRFDTILQVAPHLFDEFQILSPSMPGFGEGWIAPDETHTFASYADWMQDIVAQIAPRRFHLMGNSLGGATVLALASRMSSRVQSVVALNSAGMQIDGVRSVHEEIVEGSNLFEIHTPADYERLGARLFTRQMKIPRPIAVHLYREQHKQLEWHRKITADLGKSEVLSRGPGWSSYMDLPSIRVPTLMLWGADDSLFPVAHARKVAEVVPGARVELLEGVGHCAHLEAPKQLAQAFRSFVQSLS